MSGSCSVVSTRIVSIFNFLCLHSNQKGLKMAKLKPEQKKISFALQAYCATTQIAAKSVLKRRRGLVRDPTRT